MTGLGRRSLSRALWLAAAWAASPERPLRADSTSGKAVAEALFRDGRQLLEAGDLAGACPKFAESLRVDRTLGTLLYLAACHEQEGRTASAWSEFSSAVPWAERSGQVERIAFARKHLGALEPRLTLVVIRAPTVAGLQLKIDDGLLGAATGDTPLPLDPGEHTIEASAPNALAWRTTLVVQAKPGRIEVMVPELKPPASVATVPSSPAAPGPPPSSSTTREVPRVSSGPPDLRWVTWLVVGVAGAGVMAGSAFGALTLASRDAAVSRCPGNRCDPTGLDDIGRARAYATVSTAGFAVGIAGALGATYLLIRGGSRDVQPRPTGAIVTVVPLASAREGGISLQARFP